jgi:hypothetical protein
LADFFFLGAQIAPGFVIIDNVSFMVGKRFETNVAH